MGDLKRCLVIGSPVLHSLSPLIHQAGYRFLGIAHQYHYEAQEVTADELSEMIAGVRGSDIVGISCTMPHKRAVIPHLDELSPEAQAIGAVNTIIVREGKLIGTNTDGEGILRPLYERMRKVRGQRADLIFESAFLRGQRVLVLGAGGAARAAIYALHLRGAEVVIANRTLKNAQELIEQMGDRDLRISGVTLDMLQDPLMTHSFDIIINTTSVGMGALRDQSLLSADQLREGQIVFESIYSPFETRLIQEATRARASTILGIEMLLCQAYAQFELFTGRFCPRGLIRRHVYESQKVTKHLTSNLAPPPLICGVVMGESLEVFMSRLEALQEEFEIIELRVDSIRGLKLEYVDLISAKISRPAIVTCRPERLGLRGGFEGSARDQALILQRFIDLGIGWVDLDVRVLHEIKAFQDLSFELGETQLICSFHDFEGLFDERSLTQIYQEMISERPSIFKFACQAPSALHVDHLLRFLLRYKEESRLIVIGMGEAAKFSRVFFPLIGSYLTFARSASASVSAQSAPGQLTQAELTQIYHLL